MLIKPRTLIFFILLIILAACSREKEKNKITIATLKGPSAMGMIKMIDSIQSVNQPSIELTIYTEPIQVRKLMIENQLDIAILPTTMASILYNKKIPYQLAAISTWGTLYLCGKDTSVHCLNDLKNKKVNLMAKGMTPDVLFKNLLTKNNIDTEKDIRLDYSFPTHIELANALAADQVDLAVLSEPYVSLVLYKNKDISVIADLTEEWKKAYPEIPIAQTAVLIHSEFAKNNPIELYNILEAYRESTYWVNNHQENAAELIVKFDILPNKEIAINSIPRSNLGFDFAYNIKTQIINYLSVFEEMNPEIIGGKIPDDNFFLNEVKQEIIY